MPPHSALNPEQITELDGGFPDPNTLHRAVVFIRADFSGPALKSMDNLVKAFKIGLDASWKLFILNTEAIDFEAFIKAYGQFPSSGGWGEAFWIIDGEVVHKDRGYYNPSLERLLWDRIRQFTSHDTLDVPDLSDNSFVDAVMKQCKGLSESQLEIHDRDCRDFRDLSLAVVTLYDYHLAQSVVELRSLAQQIRTAANPYLRLIVLNASAVSYQDMMSIFGELPSPGKTYWIRNGEVVSYADSFFNGP